MQITNGPLEVPMDVLTRIHYWLPLIYKITFSRVCRAAYYAGPVESRDIGRMVRSRLPFSRLDMLFECGGSLTGGFLLDCLYETDYHSDVDVLFDIGIMSFTEWHSGWYADLVVRDEDTAEVKFSKFAKVMKSISTSPLPQGRVLVDESKSICYTRKLTVEGTTFDIILCAPGKQRYIQQYDLDFCKVLWDGKTFTAQCPMSLIKKHSVMRHRSDGEVIEYINEGSPDHIIRDIVGPERSGQRAAKYIDRGFSIEYLMSI